MKKPRALVLGRVFTLLNEFVVENGSEWDIWVINWLNKVSGV